MPIRRVQQQSDRGSIRDLANGDDEKYPPTPLELRLKGLYEHALVTRDQALINSLGLIPLNGEANNPVSIYRHREYVKALSEELAEKIQQTAQEIEGCLAVEESSLPQELKWARYKQARAQSVITQENDLVKTASADGSTQTRSVRSFRRVI
jgi:hypothetical protein